MEAILSCPKCHQPLKLSSHYCPSCGYQISFRPLSTSTLAQVFFILGTMFFPPLGIILGRRYLRQGDPKSIFIGFAAIAIAFIEIVVISILIINLTHQLQAQISHELPHYGLQS